MPFIGTVKLQKVSGATLNGLYAKLAESGRKNGKRGLSPATVHHVHSLPAPGISRRRALGPPAAQPGRRSRPAPSARHRAPRDEDLDGRAAEGLPFTKDDASTRSGTPWR